MGREKVKIVFDSSVWVSTLEYGGTPRRAIERAQAADTILVCTEIEDEVVDVMSRKFGRTPHIVRTQLSELLQTAMRIVLDHSLTGICRDPKDDFLLECAQTGHADLLITGDKDLLDLASFGPTRILTPRQYLDLAPRESPQ